MKRKTLTLFALIQALALGLSTVLGAETVENAEFLAEKSDAYVLETVQPKYPAEMLQRGVQGRVLVKLRVNESGEVDGLSVVSSTNDAFSRAAEKSLSKWYFQPGTREGEPVPQTVMVPVSFLIEDARSQAMASL